MTDSHNAPRLGAAQAALIQGPVSIHLATCDAACVAATVRGFGCHVSADRETVSVYLVARYAEAVLRDLRAGGALAVVFSRPSTHETVQLKATQAGLAPLAAGERDIMQAYARAFITELGTIGYLEPYAQALMQMEHEDAVAVRFQPAAVFDQTPGPKAGRRVEPTA